MAKKTVVRLDGAPRRVNRSSGKPTTNCRSTDERFASDAEGVTPGRLFVSALSERGTT